ncbi:semaphorin-5A-like [Tubulanus polymorphus]|uniref:semaphorin-5A-like n=1 Tax=Tubulanus polymorphus TaxID=672921 RepID=UPI003DA39580
MNGDPEGKVGVVREVRYNQNGDVETVEVEWDSGLDQIHKMGQDDTYELKLATLGHYGWGEWTKCSAQCGRGSKHRIQIATCVDGDYCVGKKKTENKHCNIPCKDGKQLVDLMQYGTHVVPGQDWNEDTNGKPQGQIGIVVDFRSDERNQPNSVEVKWDSGADRFHDMGNNGKYELDLAIEGHYSWGHWSKCSATCGIGSRKRYQKNKCLGGDYCTGEKLDISEQCFHPCKGVHEAYCDGEIQNYDFFLKLHEDQDIPEKLAENCYWQTKDGVRHHIHFPHGVYFHGEDKNES